MSLAKYHQKRDFERTREPRGKALAKKRAGFSFVVQKHAARQLHYDFRLELDGELLSWAVPKGPSIDPTVKRLAMEVEPHPVAYGDFEGTIPKGEYGGGTVMVWDRGSWQPEGDPRAAIEKGHLKFSLQGQKLKGAWHLVRTRGPDASGDGETKGKPWLLFKSRDAAAREGEALLDEAPESALTGRDMEAIANDVEGKVWHGNHAEKTAKTPKSTRKTRRGRSSLPDAVEPELATLVDTVPEGDDWIHEIKFDGYRVIAHVDHGKVSLFTRNGKDWTERMPSLRAALAKLDADSALLDGELVALNDQGVSSFQLLQNSLKAEHDSALVYYAFDALHLDGEDLTTRPLVERKSRLRELLERNEAALEGTVRLSAHVVGSGRAFFDSASKMGLEGTIAKRAQSPYRSGRGRDWLKIKCSKRQEFTIVGYSDPGGSRRHFGALLLAFEREGKLVYAGKVGTGFSEASLAELAGKLKKLASKECPLHDPPRGAEARGVHWVKPKLVAQVRFTELTADGHVRHPSFEGLRDDKPAKDVKLETPAPAEPEPPSERAGYVITNPTKVLYPKQGITKQELLDYYALAAPFMLPHVGNRPLTLLRGPNGIGKQLFFTKHPHQGDPKGLRSVAIRESEGKLPYRVLDDAEGLFGLVQLGALEIHTWGARADDFEHPDILVFDLDPDENLGYEKVIEGARTLRQLFDSAKLESFVKTTGGKGLHVCVPITPDLDWDTVKDFTGRIAQALAGASPKSYVATVSKAARKGKIFIDYLRNARGATFIAPYSTRARDGATIAVPLDWDELSPKLPPHHFNVRNIEQRLLKMTQDPWHAMSKVRQRLRPERVEP